MTTYGTCTQGDSRGGGCGSGAEVECPGYGARVGRQGNRVENALPVRHCIWRGAYQTEPRELKMGKRRLLAWEKCGSVWHLRWRGASRQGGEAGKNEIDAGQVKNRPK